MKKIPQSCDTAERTCLPDPAAAKEQMEDAVDRVLASLRKGKPVKLPGLGKLIPVARSKSK
jgi:nucleoid DNA-binding protein